MRRPRLLDLYCGAGGCARGYQAAGFEVVGVDIEPQPNYCGDEFWLGDALEVASWHVEAAEFDAVHASPPCYAYSRMRAFQWQHSPPDLVAATRELLDRSPTPYVIENVLGAPIRYDLVLCGEMFGLRVHRHRAFETRGFFAMQAPHSRHRRRGARTNCETGADVARWITGHYADHDDALEAMGIDWMGRRELANAVPPAYTQHIGAYLLAEVKSRMGADLENGPVGQLALF